ncbi:MAG: aminoglycoside phosphotransferase [Nitrospirales bacterium]|nr:MAG: aminoglycoside phosphotransferase [Nitrospirales bacterium]
MKGPVLRSPSALNDDLLKKTLQADLPFSAQFVGCHPLAGDASNRRYYRLTLTEAPVDSLILMQLADPEGFKASEEAVSGSTQDLTELPFVNVLTFLQSLGIVVPALYYFDESAGLLYLEDLGDLTLTEACSTADPARREQLYDQAIDCLVQIHLRATSHEQSSCLAFGRAFDVPLLMWELEHFLEYGVEARGGKPLGDAAARQIREVFQTMSEYLVAQPRVFTHRDYHSRNLMVDGERLGVIDFQDALLGPATYDLASLLRDSYIALPEHLIDQMIDRYVQGMCEGVGRSKQGELLLNDPVAFRRLFDYTSIQRNLKAAGRFVYIDRVKQNSKFLADIPRTLGYVQKNLTKYPELRTLLSHLSPHVPEWQ